MQVLKILDMRDYDPAWEKFSREAVRALILRDGKITLVRSLRDGFYNFPGGGIESGESYFDTLIRETPEETRLHVLPSPYANLE